MEKRWQFGSPDEGLMEALSAQLHISPVLAQVLDNRGIADVRAGDHFLHDTLADMADPFLMKGMENAVIGLEQAITEKQRIVIYGDYDVDGITSTSLVYSVLRDLGASPQFYIPERESEGYGLNEGALEQLSRQADLLITVDCGISSHDLVQQFSPVLDMIITDHHEPPEQIPPALAVLNPKQAGCPYPFKELAGAGVAYVLCRALWQRHCHEDLPGYTDLAALGTIADLVPLTGENRILVRHGLAAMKEGKRTGIKALLDASNLSGKDITAGRIAFTAAPRLNAAGRISHATKGVELLLETDAAKAAADAAELSRLNTERQDHRPDSAAPGIHPARPVLFRRLLQSGPDPVPGKRRKSRLPGAERAHHESLPGNGPGGTVVRAGGSGGGHAPGTGENPGRKEAAGVRFLLSCRKVEWRSTRWKI